ncbi:MAG: tetratricopeptide repeat protein [Treponema sp.]|nr:tetratricopeptide repeat protein [Treponema sp.]
MGINTRYTIGKILLLFVLLSAASFFAAAQTITDASTQETLTEVSRLMERREFTAALALFDTISAEARQTTERQLLRASLLNAAGRPADARSIASGIVSREPDNVDALLVLASSAALTGNEREQRTSLDRVLRADPQNLKAHSDLGYIALQTNSVRTAAGHFDRALAIDPNYREALVGRAIAYRYSGDLRRSEQLLNQAIRQNPQWATPYHERARLYKGAGFPEDALLDLDTAKSLEPENYWISVDRAATLLDLNRRPEALEELNHSVALDPRGFLGYVYRAGIRDDMGYFNDAAEDYQVLTRIRPEYYFAAEGLGIIKMRNRQFTEARDAFLTAYRQAPREFRYALLAAYNWMKAGRTSDPKQFITQVLRTAPRDSAEWRLLRLYHDLSGDMDVIANANREQNLDTKSMMFFYIALYYDAIGSRTLANNFFLQVKELNRTHTIEWKMNEMMLDDRGINLQ